MTAAEYHQSLDALPFGKRLPGALYLLDPGADPRIPSLLRITVAELRRRLEIGPKFNLLKFHTASPKLSFLAYPDFESDPHPTLKEAVIVDLVTGKTRRDDYRSRANPPILHRKETFLPPEHPLHSKSPELTRIKIDLKRLFVTVIDHTTGPEHQLLFFKERFLAKDHPDRAKMERFSAKLRSVTKMVAV